MALRFSNDGPEFPGKFVDSLLAGEVVFLCGTGISTPQMPDFRCLVERTYEILDVDKTQEQIAFCENRFEEVLGSLSRRLSDQNAVTRTVSELLTIPEHPTLDHHCAILRLSRDLDNRISVVTTNFDTLLERAVVQIMPGKTPRDISFAGQALPVPGSPSFSGIIHIHGRLSDAVLGLESTPLVLTSADYGDAYMRSGWASRFLFDLARCKTIVLVGYSANDAPVRYFLNVLEADRARFPDIKPIYAFGAYEIDQKEAMRSWGTLAVTPLPYKKVNPDTGKDDHIPLWRDLAALADVVDRPKQSRQQRARKILKQPAAEADYGVRKELGWLFGTRRDLWSVALKAITDPEWFTVFQEEELWSTEDAAWVIAVWIAKNFQSRERLKCACEWQRRLGRPFTENVKKRLIPAEDFNEIWMRVWRHFCLVEPVQSDAIVYYEMKKRLMSCVVLDSDLQKAVSLLAPKLELSPSHRELRNDNDSQQIKRLSDIVWSRMEISDPDSAEELICTLCAMPERAARILDLATAQLQSTLEHESELELIEDEYDCNDSTVPSIEQHTQNKHHHGVNFLVRVLVGFLSHTSTLDQDRTRSLVTGWKSLPGRTGLRLCLHAMRNDELFDADEAMSALLSTSDVDFWRIRREIALLLKERAGKASPVRVSEIEERILQSGDAFFNRYAIGLGMSDWRSHVRDGAVWLRLNMLQDAGVLSKTGITELEAIKIRLDHLDRVVEDRDFFETYSYGARWVVGDPTPVVEAVENDRLRVARKLAHSPELDLRLGWSTFCHSDPKGAFNLLVKEDLTPENGALWDEFLGGLVFGDEASKAIRDELVVEAFKHLADVDSNTLQPLVLGLTDLIFSTPRQRIVNVERWLDRLWEIISLQPNKPLDLSEDLYEQAINSAAGKLAQTLLLEIDAKRQENVSPTNSQRQLLREISNCKGTFGLLGSAVFVPNLSILLTVDRQWVIDDLGPCINAENAEGVALRSVMLSYELISPELTQVLGQAVMKGAVESKASGHAANVAENILQPALADVRGDNTVHWGLTATDVAQVLRDSPSFFRREVLQRLARLYEIEGAGAEETWRISIKPFFMKVWPKEREFLNVLLTHQLITLAVGAGNEFPDALEQLLPYLVPFDRGLGLPDISSSKVPKRFPIETLRLLWRVCGPKSRGSYYGISKIIDQLIKADPGLEVDRRLQWLEHRAERFD